MESFTFKLLRTFEKFFFLENYHLRCLATNRGALDYRLGNVAGEIIKTTEAIRENNETTNTIDDTKQMDEMHEIIQSEEERTDIDDDHKENVNKREEESTIVNITERTNGIATEVTMIFEMPTFTAIIEDKKDMKHVIETNDTNGAEDTSEVTVEDTEDKDSDLPEQKLRMQWV